MKRLSLLLALAVMPDEAFSWLLLACQPSAMLHGAKTQIWPDGLGGFQTESRDAIEHVQKEAKRLIEEMS